MLMLIAVATLSNLLKDGGMSEEPPLSGVCGCVCLVLTVFCAIVDTFIDETKNTHTGRQTRPFVGLDY